MVKSGGRVAGWFKYEKYESVGIFTFFDDMNSLQFDDLKTLLMQSIEQMDRVVLNFRREIKMDQRAKELFSAAYRISDRLNKPLIFNGYHFDKHNGSKPRKRAARSRYRGNP